MVKIDYPFCQNTEGIKPVNVRVRAGSGQIGLGGPSMGVIDSVQSTLSMLLLGEGGGHAPPGKFLKLSPRKCHPEAYLA